MRHVRRDMIEALKLHEPETLLKLIVMDKRKCKKVDVQNCDYFITISIF